MKKYGFIYLWYDKKRKMFYVGCHWGQEDDGYICSSNRMRDAYRRRPTDFKRKILRRIHTNKKDLLEEEYRWLSMIKCHELCKKYYNMHNHHFGHWVINDTNRSNISEKMRSFQNERVCNGTHHWLGDSNISVQKIKNGTHHWLGDAHREKTRNIQFQRLKEGVHPFCNKELSANTNRERVCNGTHNFMQKDWIEESSSRRSDTWEVTFPNGDVVVIKNLRRFCEQNQLNQSAMNQVGLGKKLHHKRFLCKKLKKGEIKGKPAKDMENK